MISASFISELIERADCYEVVNRRVPLKPKGDNGWACCPFHDEKTSSFSVSRSKNFYHCFGCGKHGNAISFLMDYEGLDYPTAIEKLADEVGMVVRYEGGKKTDFQKVKLTDVMEMAQKFYRQQFSGSAGINARKYIHERGLTDETIEKFGIGYSPDAWHALRDALKNVDQKSLKDAGLLRDGRNGEAYDFFRNRLMFPIKNARGKIIAFSARTMTGEEPKYINTGETPIFVKGQEIFGFYEARKFIQEKKRAIVVEGQMDVIQLSQAGFGEACAPLGTAIKTEHIEKLFKATDQIIFSFDGDTAGRKAAKRALTLALPLIQDQRKVSFLFLPDGEDPDSLVKKFGKQAFEEQIARSQPLSKYFLDSLKEGKDLSIPEDKGALIAEAKPLIASIKNDVLKSEFISRIAVLLLMDKKLLEKEFGIQTVEKSASSPRFPVRNTPFQNGVGQGGSFNRGKSFQPPFPYRNKFGSNPPLLRQSLPALGAETLLDSVLRNFLLFPQIAYEFREQVFELLINEEFPSAQAILELIESICQSEEEEFVFWNVVPSQEEDSEIPEFEAKMEKIRLQLLNMLSQTPHATLIREQAMKAGVIRPSYKLARMETQQVFLTMEIQIRQMELERLAGELQSSADRELYKQLSQRWMDAKKEKTMITNKINDYLAHQL